MVNSSLLSEAGPNPVIYSAAAVTRVITLLLLVTITNFIFTIYHLYMRKKPEFSNRVLSVLYSFHAFLLQVGSFLILIIFCDETSEYEKFNRSFEIFITIRMLHLSCVCINVFFIGMATVIQHFKMEIYILISMRITRKILYSTTILLSIIINIFVKLSVNEKENNEKLENYQNVIKRVCTWLNMMALTMSLLVLLSNMKFYLKKMIFYWLGHARDYFLWKRDRVTPIVTIGMEMRQIEVVNFDGLEPYNTNANSILGNHRIDIEENIRLVLSDKNL